MAGGDSNPPPKSDTAGSSVEDSAVVHPGGGAIEDPGDREIPLKREAGDPFAKDLSDDQRAARLEGAKLSCRTLVGKRCGENMYRVDRFRRFLPRRGSDGQGLIQFWGPRATRLYDLEPDAEVPDWTVREDRKLHTVGVGEIVSIRRPLK